MRSATCAASGLPPDQDTCFGGDQPNVRVNQHLALPRRPGPGPAGPPSSTQKGSVMTTEPMAALLTVLRVAGYVGFVLWAGPLVFWTLVWPTGHRHRRLLRLSGVGAVLLILTSMAEPAIRLTAGGQPLDEVAPPLAGAAVLLRLAILVGSLFYLVDLVSGAVVGGRRAVALAAIVVVAATVAVQPIALGQPGPLLAALGTFRSPAGDRGVAGRAGRAGHRRPSRCRARRRRRGRRAGHPLLAGGHARTRPPGAGQRPHRPGRDRGPRRRAPGPGAPAPASGCSLPCSWSPGTPIGPPLGWPSAASSARSASPGRRGTGP